MPLKPFKDSRALSMGVELELQILSTHDYDLTRGADDLIALLNKRPHPGQVRHEITQSMLEVATGIHDGHASLLEELRGVRDRVVAAADSLNLAISGGGTHPFQHWHDRSIHDSERFNFLSGLYGYLAKQFTVFGQHVHIGCPHGDQALYLLHGLARYVPHFVALAASSPYYQGADTAFDSSRLNAIFAFPLSGRAPFLLRWAQFDAYFARMQALGIVASMKDFYWDIRPKPEYGTIEIRVCDTPLSVERAAAIAAYIQALCRYLLVERPHIPSEDDYLPYTFNSFQACRFGLDGSLVGVATGERRSVRDDLLASLERVEQHAAELDCLPAIHALRQVAEREGSDAQWIRDVHGESGSMNEVMRRQSLRWRGDGRRA